MIPEANTQELQFALAQMTTRDWKTLARKTCEDRRYHKGLRSIECGARVLPETMPDTMVASDRHEETLGYRVRRCTCCDGKGP